MAKAKVNDIDIYYEVHGQGEPLLLISGLGANIGCWYAQIADFSKGYRTIIFDNRGAGYTDKPNLPYSIRMFVDDAIGLLDKLGIPKAHILGASMGGMIAQEMSLNYPERVKSLTLCCTHCGGEKKVESPRDVYQAIIDNAGLTQEEIVRKNLPFLFTENFIKNHPRDIEKFVAIVLDYPRQPLKAFNCQVEAILAHDTFENLSRIKTPTLILAARKDVLLPPRNSEILAGKIPSSKLIIFKNGGHLFNVEIADKFNRAVLEFLKK